MAIAHDSQRPGRRKAKTAEIDFGEFWDGLSREPLSPVQRRHFDFPAFPLNVEWTTLQSGLTVFRICGDSETDEPIRLRLPGKLSLLGSVLAGSPGAVFPDLGRRHFQAGDWLILRAREFQLVAPKRFSVLLFAAEAPLLQKLIACAAPDECQTLRCLTCPQLQEPSLISHPGGKRLNWLDREIDFPESTGLDERLAFEIRCLDWLRELFRQPELSNQFCGSGCSLEEESILREVAAFLENHLEEPHSLPDLCRRFHLNEFKLKHGFKALFGTTVFRHLRQLRLQKAEQLLQETDRTVLDVANAVGYSNPSHFARNFKEQVGLLPKSYQTLHRRV